MIRRGSTQAVALPCYNLGYHFDRSQRDGGVGCLFICRCVWVGNLTCFCLRVSGKRDSRTRKASTINDIGFWVVSGWEGSSRPSRLLRLAEQQFPRLRPIQLPASEKRPRKRRQPLDAPFDHICTCLRGSSCTLPSFRFAARPASSNKRQPRLQYCNRDICPRL